MSRADAASAVGEQVGGDHLLARLLESSNDLVWCTSLDGGKLLYVNSAAERIYGRPLADLLKSKNAWLEVMHAEDRVLFE